MLTAGFVCQRMGIDEGQRTEQQLQDS